LQYDHRQSLPYWIISTAHALEVEFNEVLSPLGITFRQAEVLALLALEGTLSQVEVARRMGVEAPTLAGIVARMEAAGWIVRESCPSDRRKKLLRATEQVEPIWAQTVERAQQVRARLAMGFTPEQVRELIAALEALYNNLKKDSPQAEEDAGVVAQEVPG
jgi:MarR family transcriptional regulator for hemolysin